MGSSRKLGCKSFGVQRNKVRLLRRPGPAGVMLIRGPYSLGTLILRTTSLFGKPPGMKTKASRACLAA